jgi:hypothetical protein
MSETFDQILPLAVYFVSADLRAGQPVQGDKKQMYRTAFVQGPGSRPGLLDLYLLESPRSNKPDAAGEKTDIPFLEEATLEDWSHGREYCCLRLKPPAASTARPRQTQIAMPPPIKSVRSRMEESHVEQLERTDADEPQPEQPAEEPEKTQGKTQTKKPAAGKKQTPAPPAKPSRRKADLEPLDFKIPEAGGVRRSSDRDKPGA